MVFKARIGNGRGTAKHLFWKTGLKRQDRTYGRERKQRTRGPKVVGVLGAVVGNRMSRA